MAGEKFNFRDRVTIEGRPGLFLFLAEEGEKSTVSLISGGTEEGFPETVDSGLLHKAPNRAPLAHS
jgi:hypothetical protein